MPSVTTKGELRVHPQIAKRVALKGRTITMAFDAGRANNPNVADGEALTTIAIESEGAIVEAAAVTFTDDGKDQGPDDLAFREGKAALECVLDSAVPANPLRLLRELESLGRHERSERADALLQHFPFLAMLRRMGPITINRVADVLNRVAGIPKTDTKKAVLGFAAQLRNKNGNGHDHDNSVTYCRRDGRLCRRRRIDNEMVYEPLANFDATIVEEVAVDDGIEVTHTFRIEGHLDDGTALPEAIVGAAEFEAMQWIVPKWGARAIPSPGRGTRDELRAAIQNLSSPTQTVRYRHTGWREIDDGDQVYLHAGGAVGATNIQVDLPSSLQRFVLAHGVENPAEAVSISASFLMCGPPEVTIPILAATYLAPLSSILEPDFVLWERGQSGAMKTVLASLAQAHYGECDRKSLPIDWQSTANAIEYILSIAKDTLVVLDDYAPQHDARAQRELASKASQVVRSVGNRAGRERLTRNLELRATRYPRGVLLCTGEDTPPGSSINARLAVLHVEREKLNIAAITELQRQRSRLPESMRSYIDWLRPQMQELQVSLPQAHEAARNEFRNSGKHLRAPEALAHLWIGFDLFLNFGVEVGGITNDEAASWRTSAMSALLRLAGYQDDGQKAVDPARAFIETLATLRQQGKIVLHVAGPGQDLPDIFSSAEMIGWKDAAYAYLLPDAARRVVSRALRESGDHMPLKERALNEALVQGGYAEPGKNSVTKTKGIRGKKQRVLWVPLRFIEGEETGKENGDVEDVQRSLDLASPRS